MAQRGRALGSGTKIRSKHGPGLQVRTGSSLGAPAPESSAKVFPGNFLLACCSCYDEFQNNSARKPGCQALKEGCKDTKAMTGHQGLSAWVQNALAWVPASSQASVFQHENQGPSRASNLSASLAGAGLHGGQWQEHGLESDVWAGASVLLFTSCESFF